jgi:hypothetical protein
MNEESPRCNAISPTALLLLSADRPFSQSHPAEIRVTIVGARFACLAGLRPSHPQKSNLDLDQATAHPAQSSRSGTRGSFAPGRLPKLASPPRQARFLIEIQARQQGYVRST